MTTAPDLAAALEAALAALAASEVALLAERHAARHDPLTGALNRLGGLEELAVLERPFALAMIDVDHFREVNRLPGSHATGDRVLCEIVELLQGRPGDLLIRWGGEELLLALAHTDVDGAAARLLRFLGAVRAQVQAGHLSVTFSAGVAEVTDGVSVGDAIAAADAALARAKAEGRARVVTASPWSVAPDLRSTG